MNVQCVQKPNKILTFTSFMILIIRIILICTTYYFESNKVRNFLRVTPPPHVLYTHLQLS